MLFNPPTLTIDSTAKLSNIPDVLVADVMQSFTMANPKYADAQKRTGYAPRNIPKQLKFFTLENDYISFPRGAVRTVIDFCQKRGVRLVLKDNRVSRPLEKKITFTGKLREYQNKAVESVLANDFGVVEAGTGAGKTVVAVAAVARKSVYTVICVPSKELMYQWVKRLCSFTDLKEEDIGLMGDGIFDVKPITVAIINTLSAHADELRNYFEYIVVDEAHRVAVEMYIGGPLTSLATKTMTGLSATLMRGDGLIDLLFWFIGRVLHTVDPNHLREIGAIMEPFIWQKATGFFLENQNIPYSRLIAELIADDSRNNMIANEAIADARWRAGHGGGTVMVGSDRVSHLKTLQKLIAAQLGEENVLLLTGELKKEKRLAVAERLDKGNVAVLVANVTLIGEGFDCPGLVSCHLAIPIADRKRIIQIVGRAVRPEEGKIPVIADYIDRRIGLFDHRAKQRLEIFIKDTFGKVISVPPWRKEETTKRQSEDHKTVLIDKEKEVSAQAKKQPSQPTKSQSGNRVQQQLPFGKQRSLFDLPERQAPRPY